MIPLVRVVRFRIVGSYVSWYLGGVLRWLWLLACCACLSETVPKVKVLAVGLGVYLYGRYSGLLASVPVSAHLGAA